MEQDVLVSVIVPVYNVEEYLGRCVDSIRSQTYKNLEIILVDDGATDTSGAICDAIAAQDPRVKVIHKENGGLSSARNAGIDAAQGDFLEFVDSDDWIEPDTVESFLQEAAAHQTELVVGGRWDVSGRTGEKRRGMCPPKQEVISGEELVRRIFRWDHCDSSACDKLFARRLFREIRFPQGVVCEDVPIMYQIVLDAGRISMLPKPIYNYYHRAGSITYTAISDKNFHFARHTEKILPFMEDHYPGLLPETRYLRVRSLVYAIQSMDLALDADRKRFWQDGQVQRSMLRRQLPFIVTSPFFTWKEKITDVLLALNLYRCLRRFFSKQK